MMKCEFEKLFGSEVSQEDYELYEIIYRDYPGIKDKQHIVDLVKIGGKSVIQDMLPKARMMKILEDTVREKKEKREEIVKKLDSDITFLYNLMKMLLVSPVELVENKMREKVWEEAEKLELIH